MQTGSRLFGEDVGIASFGQAVRENIGDSMRIADALVIEQRYVEPRMAHNAGHVQHQIAGTPGGVMDTDGVAVVVLENLADRVFGLVDQPEQLVDVACHQRGRCFVRQQFRILGHEAKRRNQGARRVAGAVEGADTTLVVAGGGGQLVKNFVGALSVDQPLPDGAIEHAKEGFVRRALQNVMAVCFDVVGQLGVVDSARGILQAL